ESQRIMASPACANDDLANTVFRIDSPVGVLRREAFVGMFVADEQKVRMRGVQILDDLLQLRMHGVLPKNPAAEKCVMTVRDDARGGMFAKILLQPRLFR